MRTLISAAAALCVIGTVSHAQTPLEAPFRDTAISGPLSSEELDEAGRLKRSGFEPLAMIAKEKRTVRRVSYLDPFHSAAMPGVSIEKQADGEIVLNLTANRGKLKERVKITQAEWDDLVALDSQAFEKPKNPLTQAETKEMCHSDSIVIETSDAGNTRRRDASHCMRETEAMLYGYKVAEIAVKNIEYCREYQASDREASAQLVECLREKLYDTD